MKKKLTNFPLEGKTETQTNKKNQKQNNFNLTMQALR